MNSVLMVILIVVPSLLALLFVLRLFLRHVADSMNSLITVQFNADDVVKQEPLANFFGQESKGKGQVRGNGALILTHEALHFFLAAPRRSWEVPLSDITAISFPDSHLGKSKFQPLLKIDFILDGEADSLAWLVTDPESWKHEILEAQKKEIKGKEV